MKTLAITAAALCLLSSAALAQPAAVQGPGPGPSRGMGAGMGPGMMGGNMAMDEFMRAMQPSMQAIMRATDRDPDRAFALKMIEHHRGGIAMMDVLLARGDDAQLKRKAQSMKQAQEKEIGELQAWLDRHGGRAAQP